jgi:hypothetical protein
VTQAEALPDATKEDCIFDSAWHVLIHYRDDEDIRRDDPEYAVSQKTALANWIDRLRAR